ncbi:MAG: hypothetical protein G3M70_17405 [Candidatus Nitronauta litoralis]|uniref:Organic solvent tolerance-like N-terminal domain-containing protein n=1 Tax=Candidatus Nitronauta litoralis TaxID=2705533 RepID=A0A7T0G200_9BACT|nr:MAG: hypothetical protein G3M70_17405 [Candidatus Nitronauta litoralis]
MKPSIYFKIITCLLWGGLILLLTLPVNAQDRGLKSSLSEKKEPIEITSDRMRSEERGQKIIFSGNVLAIWGDLSIRSDILEIYNHSDKKDTNPSTASLGEGQQLDKIIAIGNVDVRRGDRRAKGNRATYLDKEQTITLKGNPRAKAWEGDSIIEGREMIFFLDTDRFQANGQVRIKSYPNNHPTQKPRSNPRGKTALNPR